MFTKYSVRYLGKRKKIRILVYSQKWPNMKSDKCTDLGLRLMRKLAMCLNPLPPTLPQDTSQPQLPPPHFIPPSHLAPPSSPTPPALDGWRLHKRQKAVSVWWPLWPLLYQAREGSKSFDSFTSYKSFSSCFSYISFTSYSTCIPPQECPELPDPSHGQVELQGRHFKVSVMYYKYVVTGLNN